MRIGFLGLSLALFLVACGGDEKQPIIINTPPQQAAPTVVVPAQPQSQPVNPVVVTPNGTITR
jgi:hypothetical protein